MGTTGTEFAHRTAGRIVLGVACIVVAGLCALLTPVSARADGDPASDELVVSNVFYPYSSTVPQAAQTTLNGTVTRAHRDGVALKVALIARRSDLGSITALYGDPQRYAEFLDTEISYERKVPLLVVMPSGFGTEGLSARLQRVVLGSPKPSGDSGSDLAAAATSVVTRINGAAATTGSRADDSTATASSGTTQRTVLLLALVLAAVLVAGVLIVLRVFFPPA